MQSSFLPFSSLLLCSLASRNWANPSMFLNSGTTW
jgi:hypothetical protein